jgi:hypothetical protein
MAHGRFPREYISDPHICKAIEEIYADINNFTWELFDGDEETPDNADITVVLPPMVYDGYVVKGLFFSRAVDFLYKEVPKLRSFFMCMAYSMFSSYPWADYADAYLACYSNHPRELWYREKHASRSHTYFIPLAETDFLNEYRFAPVRGVEKDIDVLCVSRLQDVKNVQMIARALVVYRSKYRRQIRMTLITGHRNGVSSGALPPYARDQLAAVKSILGKIEDYVDLIGYVNHWTELPKFYSRSKVFVLGSLIEGKNQFARQGHPIASHEAGVCCAFDPEALADTIHLVLENPKAFSPRLSYLKQNGRRNFLNQCLDSIPYYRDTLPGFIPGQHAQNQWIDAAIHCSYGMDLNTFLYRPGPALARAWGITNIKHLADQYEKVVTDL